MSEHQLVLKRVFDAPAAKVYQAWVDPELMKQWFVPKPWTISKVENDVRPGGKCLVVMKDPEGNEYPNPGVYLAVEPNKRLVFTDAYVEAWIPSGRAFMTAEILFAEKDGKTHYTAIAHHWTAEAKAEHEKMGFHEGWGQCADQLADLLKTMK
jgi:uncharacterized protein YndB with AHSA1/START domain